MANARWAYMLVCTIGDCRYCTRPMPSLAEAKQAMKTHQDNVAHKDYTDVPLPF